MFVDNLNTQTEGIAGRTFQLVHGNNYALSFFLASSALSGYRTYGGSYTIKIFLANCENFDTTSSGNPEINGDKQLIYCRSFEHIGDSDWQQYLVTFTPEKDYKMIVIYPEISNSSFNGGTYIHFLYPELIPINPTNQYLTYLDDDTTKGMTLLSACGVINASYQWEGPNGIVSNQESDVLGYDEGIGEDDEYTFSMWVEGAIGNDPQYCEDAEAPTVNKTAIQLPTTERVTCADPIAGTDNCNIIPNADFTKTPNVSGVDAFRLNRVQFWSSVNGGSPDINGTPLSGPPPIYPMNLSLMANAAGMSIFTSSINYSYEGIYAKIPQLVIGRKYAFSFFLNTISIGGETAADFTFRIALSNCQEFPITPNSIGTTVPPNLTTKQDILCQNFTGIETAGWQQYFVTFTASANWDMIVIYPEGNLGGSGLSYIHFLMPELIDVTNMIHYTENSACNYTLEACGVTNATYAWTDGDGNLIGASNPITIDATINPPLYALTLSVPNILNNPILNNNCSNNTETITVLASGNLANWAGTNSANWNDANNWNPAVVPNNALTDVYIPFAVPNQPKITVGTFQVHSIHLQSGASLTNNGTLQVARNITGDPGSIDNYSSSTVTGSIEMNGTCKAQMLAGNVFVGNDVLNFTASNNVTISSTSGEGVDVWRELGFGTATSKTLITGDNLTLVSTALTTANVAQIDASNFIDGKATVERYILTGTGSGEHTKKWQALATPTGANSTSQSVYDSWMEGGNNSSTGYGTHIPDPSWTSTTTNGFDALSLITSIKTYNSTTNGFDAIGNTSIPLYNKNGYFIFVRGDRSKTEISDNPNKTNLRSKGALFQPHTGYIPPNVTVLGGTPGKFAMVGNPYASAIDLNYMNSHGNFSNLTNDVIVWDPLLAGSQGLGGYQTLHASTGFKPTPGGTALYDAAVAYPEIQSGQAFFVQTTNNGSSGSVSFAETIKSANSRLVTRQPQMSNKKSFNANLYYGQNICDGNSVICENVFNDGIDANDAGKLFNPGENFMIMKRNNFFLSVETKKEIKEADTIFYAFKNLQKIKYQLRFMPLNMQEEDLHATLVDNYLRVRIPISLAEGGFFDFMVDGNQSSYENRFMVIFEKMNKSFTITSGSINNKTDKTSFGSISIYPNPVKDKVINIHYSQMPAGRYNLQLINQAAQVVYSNQLIISEVDGVQVIKLNKKIASANYQLLITDKSGKKILKQIFL